MSSNANCMLAYANEAARCMVLVRDAEWQAEADRRTLESMQVRLGELEKRASTAEQRMVTEAMRRKAAEERTAPDKSRTSGTEQRVRDARGSCAAKTTGGAVAEPGGDDCAVLPVASGDGMAPCYDVRARSYAAVLCQKKKEID